MHGRGIDALFAIRGGDADRDQSPAKSSSRQSYQATRNLHALPGLASGVLSMRFPAGCPLSSIAMHALSKDARFILDRMEPDRCYEALGLRALVPDVSAEGLREVMHELWVNRQVERVGYSGWRRHRSAPGPGSVDAQPDARGITSDSGFGQTKVVKPEDLFDHASFTDFFR